MLENTQQSKSFKGSLNSKIYFEVTGFKNIDKVLFVIILLPIVLMSFMFLSANNLESNKKIMIMTSSIIIGVTLYMVRTVLLKRIAESELFKNEVHGYYTEDAIEWNAGESIRIKITWKAVERAMVRKNCIGLLFGFNQRIFLHRKFFENDTVWMEFKETIKSKVSKTSALPV